MRARWPGAATAAALAIAAWFVYCSIAVMRNCSSLGTLEFGAIYWGIIGFVFSVIWWLPSAIIAGIVAWHYIPPMRIVIGLGVFVILVCAAVTWAVTPLGSPPGTCVF